MRSHQPFVTLVCALSALFLAGPSAATTFTYVVVGGGLDDGHACLSSAGAGLCAAQATFEIGPTDTFPISGSFTYDDVANTIDIDLTLATASMPGSHDGVTDVVFTSVNYVVNGMGVALAFGNQLFGNSASGSMTGFYKQLNGVTTVVGPDPIDPMSSIFSAFSCSNLDAVGLCGLTVGGSRDFNLNVGTTGSGDPSDFVHTLNFNAVIPEPTTALLFASGLAALAVSGRRRRL